MNRGDVRVTTRYDEKDFRTAIFGTIHECGHAIYEQNIDEALSGTNLSDGASMGIHESQSLFYENFIGRNKHFWTPYYKKIQEASPKQFKDISLDDFVRAINESKPSFIRVEADELTYPLHIIIRYEIEKRFSAMKCSEELPSLWNQKYQDYLGLHHRRTQRDFTGRPLGRRRFRLLPILCAWLHVCGSAETKMLEDLPEFDTLLKEGNFIR